MEGGEDCCSFSVHDIQFDSSTVVEVCLREVFRGSDAVTG